MINSPAVKEPVKLRYKKLSNGSASIYLDIYNDGKRHYDFLHLYLVPERTSQDKQQNKQTLALANAIKAQRIVDIQNGMHGFKRSSTSSKITLTEYMQMVVEHYKKRGSHRYASGIGTTIGYLRRYTKKDILLSKVDTSFIRGFIDFLGDCNLASSTQHIYLRALAASLNRAVRDGLIEQNPYSLISSEDKPALRCREREYLTLDEVRTLTATPCTNSPIVKHAFLFCCFCGLRLSDIEKLQWSDIKRDGNNVSVRIMQTKTKREVVIPLSSNAQSYLPERVNDSNKVFPMPTRTNMRFALAKWLKDANINKHITFHCARHTHATLLLTYGADIYTVSKLLGHTRVQTTEIYAKIIDDKKRQAVDLIPTL